MILLKRPADIDNDNHYWYYWRTTTDIFRCFFHPSLELQVFDACMALF